jgi:hypothetical protein
MQAAGLTTLPSQPAAAIFVSSLADLRAACFAGAKVDAFGIGGM